MEYRAALISTVYAWSAGCSIDCLISTEASATSIVSGKKPCRWLDYSLHHFSLPISMAGGSERQ
ncbi:uncharacterized protein ASPGLDRAFT_48252 [Aspergillus glaucus CBS 516.65]|uniref:Uncharacterized protein n=1 Tax=Aspergillus glaucus CBS 516.65 TaxID=1160497 RepID=A0A1L9VID9_ASPGL|nr:hypothetical protein ASPGLDRAFT_48252 [Aspergillus glaucus CBS 516.65]OJJ83686.1 hypothetical protein ASPGLDRAFT_48252 [Aspergillus glaucus CBS 516.65]